MNLPAHYLSNAVPSPILNLTASACGDVFASAETDGWRVWESTSLLPVYIKDTPNGSLSIVLPLHRTGLLFLVGGPPSPLYAPNKVIVYSLITKTACASLEFSSKVLGICARRDRLVVVLQKFVILYHIRTESAEIICEGRYETAENPRGLAAIATEPNCTLLCFPGRQTGQVAVVNLPHLGSQRRITTNQNPPFATTSIILAHTTALSALVITPSGSRIATSSIKGTLIRVYNTKTSVLLHELRRGSDSAEIFSLAIRPDGEALACASDKGTIHIWDLTTPPSASSHKRNPSNDPQTEGLTLVKPYLPKYFSSAWSDAQFKLPPPEAQAAKSLPFLDAFADEKLVKPKTVEEDRVVLIWTDMEPNKREVEYKENTEGRKERKEKREQAKKGLKVVEQASTTKAEVKRDYALVAATHSGAWYKLAAFEFEREHLSEGGRAKEKARAKEQEADGGFGAFGRCRLIEHKRFEQRDDDW